MTRRRSYLALLPCYPRLPARPRRSMSSTIRAGAPSSIRMQIARITAPVTPTPATVGGERIIHERIIHMATGDTIVTTVITANRWDAPI